MNGLAQLAVLSKYYVSGSDRAYDPLNELFLTLEEMNIQLSAQDGSGIDTSTDQVVYSSAIEFDNPDLVKAKELKIPILHRAEFLKQLIGDKQLIAVAGTAGKTTTTGLLGWIFEYLGKDPSVYNGAAVTNWKEPKTRGNIRKGNSDLWIIEADESDKSFLNFHPTHSIITNISKDHYELEELEGMFNQFEVQTSGITIRGPVLADLKLQIQMLGEHNIENAHYAAQLCIRLGFDPALVKEAISKFKGIERRLEIIGTTSGITIIDDYAHNPAKIAAALSATAESYKNIHTYWRPHGFSPLLQGMTGFVDIFTKHWKQNGGTINILPVFYAGGTVQKKVTASDLVHHLESAGVPARLMPDYPSLKKELEAHAKAGDAVLGMGARDPELPLFAKQLIAEWKTP